MSNEWEERNIIIKHNMYSILKLTMNRLGITTKSDFLLWDFALPLIYISGVKTSVLSTFVYKIMQNEQSLFTISLQCESETVEMWPLSIM